MHSELSASIVAERRSNQPETWVWMTCPACLHSVAQSIGAEAHEYSVADLHERGWCTVCGYRGCNTTLPSHLGGQRGVVEFDPDRSREAWLERMAREDRLRFMVIDTQTLEVQAEKLSLAHAVVRMVELSGYTTLITGSWRSSNLVIWKGRERIAVADVLDSAVTAEQRFSMVFSQFTRGEVFESRYRVITDDFFRMALDCKMPLAVPEQ